MNVCVCVCVCAQNNISNTHLKYKESKKKTLIICSTSKFQNSMIFFVCPSWNHVKHHRCHYYHHCVYGLRQLTTHKHKNTHTHVRAHRKFAHIEWLLAKLTVCIIRLKSLYKCILKYCRMPPNIYYICVCVRVCLHECVKCWKNGDATAAKLMGEQRK